MAKALKREGCFTVRLDRNLTAQQLWAIASDRQHLSYDLLDEIVDHPAAYRALSDWALDALGASDISVLGDPPAPEVEAAAPKRGFRLPGLGRREGQSAPSPELIQSVPVGPAPATPVFEPTASIMDPAVNPWLTVAPVFDPVPVPVPVDVKTGQVVPPQVVIGDPWFKRPAPVGVVVVLGVIQILIVLALAVVATRPAQAPTPVPASTVTSVVTVSPTPSVTPSVVATKRSVKP